MKTFSFFFTALFSFSFFFLAGCQEEVIRYVEIESTDSTETTEEAETQQQCVFIVETIANMATDYMWLYEETPVQMIRIVQTGCGENEGVNSARLLFDNDVDLNKEVDYTSYYSTSFDRYESEFGYTKVTFRDIDNTEFEVSTYISSVGYVDIDINSLLLEKDEAYLEVSYTPYTGGIYRFVPRQLLFEGILDGIHANMIQSEVFRTSAKG